MIVHSSQTGDKEIVEGLEDPVSAKGNCFCRK